MLANAVRDLYGAILAKNYFITSWCQIVIWRLARKNSKKIKIKKSATGSPEQRRYAASSL